MLCTSYLIAFLHYWPDIYSISLGFLCMPAPCMWCTNRPCSAKSTDRSHPPSRPGVVVPPDLSYAFCMPGARMCLRRASSAHADPRSACSDDAGLSGDLTVDLGSEHHACTCTYTYTHTAGTGWCGWQAFRLDVCTVCASQSARSLWTASHVHDDAYSHSVRTCVQTSYHAGRRTPDPPPFTPSYIMHAPFFSSWSY